MHRDHGHQRQDHHHHARPASCCAPAAARCWWAATSARRCPSTRSTFPADGLVGGGVSVVPARSDRPLPPARGAACSTSPPITSTGTGRSPRYVDAEGAHLRQPDARPTARCSNADDPVDVSAGLAAARGARALVQPARARWHHGVFVCDGWIVAKLQRRARERISRPVDARLALRGRAQRGERAARPPPARLWTGMARRRSGAASRRSAASRIASSACATIAGVVFYNDSKGTNVDSTVKALESFTRAGDASSRAARARGRTSGLSPRRPAGRVRARRSSSATDRDSSAGRARAGRHPAPRTRSPWRTRCGAPATRPAWATWCCSRRPAPRSTCSDLRAPRRRLQAAVRGVPGVIA